MHDNLSLRHLLPLLDVDILDARHECRGNDGFVFQDQTVGSEDDDVAEEKIEHRDSKNPEHAEIDDPADRIGDRAFFVHQDIRPGTLFQTLYHHDLRIKCNQIASGEVFRPEDPDLHAQIDADTGGRLRLNLGCAILGFGRA